MNEITSLRNPRVKEAVRLRERRHREACGRIIIDGARELVRAVEAGVKLVEAFVCESQCRSDDAQRILRHLPSTGADVWHVTEDVLGKIAFGDRAEGVVGIAQSPDASLGRLPSLPTPPLAVVLERVEKPGNVGAVLRSVDGAGASALIVADPRTDLYNPNAIRASLGTIFTRPVAAASTEATLAFLRARGMRIFAARVDGSVPYTSVDLRGPAAIVLGSEAHGLSDAWNAPDVTAIRLPMCGTADSLNVSVTAAVLLYEALRQRSV